MALFKKKSKALTRREIIARRRAEEQASSAAEPSAYQMSRTLRSKRPGETETPSERQVAHNLRARRRKLTVWLGGLLMATAVIFGLLTQLTARVTVKTTDPSIQTAVYTAVLDEYFQQRPIERLRFMVDKTALYEFFVSKTPEVQSVGLDAGRELASSVLVLSFRQPVAQWASGDKIYFVDEAGVTFEKNYFANPSIVVKDESGVPTSSGQEVINRRFLSFLGQTVSLFKQNGLIVTEAVLPPDTVRQVRFRLADKSYAVVMTIDRTAEAQVTEAVYAIRHLDGKGMRPSYIDVRVNRQVYYK